MVRSRFDEQNGGIPKHSLSIVCAPTGFGKTKLLQQWHEHFASIKDAHAAWLSLDAADNGIEVAKVSLVASLQRILPQPAEAGAAAPDNGTTTPGLFPVAILNALAGIKGNVFFFIDNYDLITDTEVQEMWLFLVSNLPGNMYCIVASRTMPAWPVTLFNANDMVKVFQPDDLRFTLSETSDYLKRHCVTDLDENQVFNLHKHTRGWAVAVKLASNAINTSRDKQELHNIVAGNNPLLLEYIEENIFPGLPEGTREFLVKTIHLEKIQAGLCGFICETDDAADHIRCLELNNLVCSIDHEKHWYEFPPFLRDYLQQNLARQGAAVIEALRRKSIEWFQLHNMPSEALVHALKIPDYELAVEIVEKDSRVLVVAGSIKILLRFYKNLPEHHVTGKPYLLYPYLWVLVITQRYREAQKQLEKMQALLSGFSHDEDNPPLLMPTQDQIKVIEYRIRQALDVNWSDSSVWLQLKSSLSGSDYLSMEQIELSLGWAYLRKEKFGEAYAAFMEARHYAERGDMPVHITIITATTHMADIRRTQGKLHEARELCNYAIHLAQQDGSRFIPVAGVAFLERSKLHYEMNLLERAEADLLEATSLFEQYSHAFYNTQARLHLAELSYERGGTDAALEVLERADTQLSEHSHEYLLKQIRADQAKYYIHKGDISTAEAILRQQKLPVDSRGPNPTFKCRQREQRAYLSLCRYLVARGKPETASAWLTKLIHQAENNGKKLFCVQLSVLLALAHAREGNEKRALRSVREMLLFGEQCGAVRTIIDEGASLIGLIRKYRETMQKRTDPSASGPSEDYINRLLVANEGKPAGEISATNTKNNYETGNKDIHALTAREREILVLISEGLSNRSIAEHLILGEGTVKWHVKNIYNKLLVNSRTQAIVKARSSGIIF